MTQYIKSCFSLPCLLQLLDGVEFTEWSKIIQGISPFTTLDESIYDYRAILEEGWEKDGVEGLPPEHF